MEFEFQYEKNVLSSFLKTLEYPIGREQLTDAAKEREVPLEMLALLQRLPDDHEFSSADEINHELTAGIR